MTTYTPLIDVADIENYFPNIKFGELTKPTNMDIAKWCEQATNIIYASIRDKYVIPVTDAQDLDILAMIAETYVLEKVGFVLSRTASVPSGKPTRTQKHADLTEFQNLLNQIKDGSLVLSATTRDASNYVSSYNVKNSIEAVSSKTEDLW